MKQLCPVCQKVVGAWHKSGVHPKCEPTTVTYSIAQTTSFSDGRPPLTPIGAGMTQAQRDAILRGINGAPRPRR